MKRLSAAPSGADPLCRGGALDALRFLAAAFIVLYHYEWQAPVSFDALHPSLTRGYLATDFFLMLSGYVLGRTYGRRLVEGRIGYGSFLLRRITRVWPAHLIVLAGFAALVAAAAAAGFALNNAHAFEWSALPGHALLAQSWALGVSPGWNTPTWSLSALIVCYALFPLIWPVLARLSGRGALVAGVAVLVAAALAAQAFGRTFYDLPGEIGVFRAVPLFVLGAALARFGAPGGLTLNGARLTGVAAAVAFVALQLLGRFDFLSILLIAAIIMAAGARTPPRASKPVARAAELAFALYITHSLAGAVWYRSLGLTDPPAAGPLAWALWASAFAFALLGAIVFHHLIDMPLQARVNHLLKRERVARPAAVPV